MSGQEVNAAEVVFREFASAAPSGWERGEIDYRYAGKTSEGSVRAYDAAGAVHYPDIDSFDFDDAIDELRDQFAQPGTGAWFSVRINLTAVGGFSLDADYDHEPAWKTPTDPGHYLEEQEIHPRDAEHQPEWFRQKLVEASSR